MNTLKLFTSCLIATSFIGIPHITNAAETTIAVLEIDGLYQKDGKGLYDQVLAAVSGASDAQYSFKYLPPKRALAAFESGAVDCVSPANTNPDFYSFSFKTVQSVSMTDAKVYIFTKAGTAPVSDISSLDGKKVGIRLGMPYGNKVETSNINFVTAPTIETNIKKLDAGRIDAFLAYWPDAYAIFDSLGMAHLPHTMDKPVAVHQDTILCRDDKNGQAIVGNFNSGFKTLEGNGELAKILGE